MDTEDKIKKIGMKLYIQLILVENDILKNIKIKYEEKKVNFLQIHFKKYYYKFSDHFVYISKDENNNNYEINFCDKNLNPCNVNEKTKKYKIIILFNYLNNQKKKMYIPINLFEFDCSKKNINKLEKFVVKIKNILNKYIFLKKIIHEISIMDKN